MKRNHAIVLTGTAVLAVVSFCYFFKQCCLPHFRTVRRHVLYRSGQPRGIGLRALRLWGVRTSVNLRGADADGAQAERAFAEEHGIAFHNIPAGNTPETIAESVARFLTVLDDKSNWPVLVHCSRGRERAGLFSAVFRMEYDHWPNQQALHEMYEFGLAPGSMPVAEAFVWDYHPRWRGDALVRNMPSAQGLPEAVWQD